MLPLMDSVPRRSPPVTVHLIILACAIVFAAELTLTQEQLEQVFHLFGVVPARYTHPAWARWVGFPIDDYWPYLTSLFLHGGWLHIISNMWALWIFGDNVEDRMGPLRFTLFYLLCGVGAGVVHTLTNHDSTVPAVGASGAISGVMAAYILLFPTARLLLMVPIFFVPFFFEAPAMLFVFVWFVSQFFNGVASLLSEGAVGGVAWWAHLGGFAMGALLTPLFVRSASGRRPLQGDEGALEAALARRRW